MPDTAIAAADAPAPAQKLDDIMLAMDVVDTLRHQEGLVARELSADQREGALIERLREIYKSQGIEVPDSVLLEGVKALEESRFVYTPPPPGWRTRLAHVWVRRERYGKIAAIGLTLLGIAAGAYNFGVVRPRQQAAERARNELAVVLPKSLKDGQAEVLAEAKVPAAREKAAALAADGERALARGDAAAARKAVADLEALRAELRREYVLRIVSRPREQSGVWRIPPNNPRGENFYLIVEAYAPDGSRLKLPITSEEDGKTETVERWGVRVSEPVFNRIRADKADDGIIQQARIGEKKRGFLDVDYSLPVLGGAITHWQ